MDLYHFHQISVKQQFAMVTSQGKFIAVRKEPKQRIELYALNRLFVELCFNLTTNKLGHIRGFENVDLLNPYLEKIKLPAIKS